MSTRTGAISGLWTTGDFADAAKAKLLPEVWDFIDGGAGAESTVRGNVQAFQDVRLRPRALTNVSRVDTRVSILGRQLEAPLLVAPTSTHTMADPGGESATATATAKLGLAMVASTMADHTIERITAAAGEAGRIWQQLYIFRDRSVTKHLAARAEACGVGALVLTVDSPWLGRRVRNLRNDFRFPPEISAGNLAASLDATPDISSPEIYSRDAMDPALTWRDVEALTSNTSLPVWVKGVLSGEDARSAIEHGAAGVIVSNHGGRQLDRAVPTLRALPEVVAAAGDVPVLMDGGIRSGIDIVIALALGARAVLVGRPVLWGLATSGEAGVSAVLSLLIEEMADAMGQAGRARIPDIDASLIAEPVANSFLPLGTA
jgi:isopentenyl diphosphate isomerase/L-lactate dehydrogenase-like FMN-dependent dehydrogenase